MPLRLVIGRANAGKTGLILGWALDALERRVPPTLVVPNLADVRRLQHELAGKAPLGVRVVTASTLMEELWLLHGDGRRLIGDATRAAVIRKVMADVASTHEVGSSATTAGFARLMERLAAHSQPSGQVRTSRLGAGGVLTLSLLEAYRSELTALDFIEAGWIGALLAAAPPAVGYVGVLRFVSHSPDQVAFYRALSEVNEVAVALTWEDGFAPTIANGAAAGLLLESATSVHPVGESSECSEIDELAARLYAPGTPVAASGSVLLGEAAGTEGEAALVARMASEAVEAGVSAERVAVVFPQLTARVGILQNALVAEGLEADFDCSQRAGASPFGRALTALATLATGGGGRTQALEYLQGPFSDAPRDEVIELDRSWRSAGAAADSVRILRDMKRLSGQTKQVVKLAQAAVRGCIDAETASDWQELTDCLIAIAALRDPGAVAADDAGVHRAVTRAVAQMASVPGAPFLAGDVIEALPSLSYGSAAEETPGRIQVIQASRVGSRRFDVVIVGGLTRSESPGSSRETFASEVGSLASGQDRAADEHIASLEFYSLVSRARQRLYLVRQTINSDGVLQLASPLLDEVVATYQSVPSRPSTGGPGTGFAQALPVATCVDARASVPVFTMGRRAERLVADKAPGRTRRLVHAHVDSDLARSAAEQRVFSATEVQTYLECPYRWFYSRMLRPREIDSVLDAASLGSLAHDLLATFYKTAASRDLARVNRANLSQALAMFDAVAKEAEARTPRAQTMGEQIDIQRAILWARRVVEDDADLWPGYLPVEHEADFGTGATFEFAGVAFRGRIDRVEAGAGGLIVTDYKSTSSVQPLVGPGIQHVLYALAAEKLLEQPVLGSVYRSLRSREIRGFYRSERLDVAPVDVHKNDIVDEAGYAEIIERTEERVAQAIDGMRSGKIPRQVHAPAKCGYCPLKLICEGAAE